MKNLALAYYRDEVGRELLSFKNENSEAILRWLHYVDVYFDQIFDGMKVDYIVRALGSNETSNTNYDTALDMLGKLLAKRFKADYVTDILTKNRTQQLKYAGNGFNRKKILDHQYSCDLRDLNKKGSYLIIDDVTTTGTTFEEIQRAINKASNYKASLNTFALVKTLWNKDYTNDKQKYNSKFYKELIA